MSKKTMKNKREGFKFCGFYLTHEIYTAVCAQKEISGRTLAMELVFLVKEALEHRLAMPTETSTNKG